VIDARQLVQRQVADAGAGIDEHVVIDEKRGGSVAGGNGAGAAEHADLHAPIVLCQDSTLKSTPAPT
jgi:hypothetical protein